MGWGSEGKVIRGQQETEKSRERREDLRGVKKVHKKGKGKLKEFRNSTKAAVS